MTVLNSNLAAAWTPEDYGALVDRVVDATSVAFTAGTVIDTQLQSIRIPILAADPSTGWYAENTPITLTDPTTTEIEIKPTKVAGLTQASNEAVADSEPAVANQIGTSLARDISKKVDAAFFANTTTNGPPGLLSVSGVQVVDTGAVWANIDAVHDGKAAALAQGANLTHILLAPDVALQLAKTKVQTGSNQGLFDNVADGITLAGLTVLVSPAIPAGNAWAVDNSQVLIVRRTGTAVVVSTDAAFGSDAVQIRATSRVGFGFANPRWHRPPVRRSLIVAALPTSADLSALMGRNLDSEQAVQVLAIVTSMAKAHTRGGRGFDANGDPVAEIRAVILTASARLLSNAKGGLLYDESVGPESISYRSAFNGWTLVERMCLDRYRINAL